eukprot:Lithocolla_globosa_v1_NODE_448_length_4011_cov_1933.656724.p2 type:complete len:179 gc:universal NODE_448_length_4011_cov_1933.656724:3168-3704(+)
MLVEVTFYSVSGYIENIVSCSEEPSCARPGKGSTPCCRVVMVFVAYITSKCELSVRLGSIRRVAHTLEESRDVLGLPNFFPLWDKVSQTQKKTTKFYPSPKTQIGSKHLNRLADRSPLEVFDNFGFCVADAKFCLFFWKSRPHPSKWGKIREAMEIRPSYDMEIRNRIFLARATVHVG